MMHEWELSTMSAETIGSSVYSSTSRQRSVAAASLKTALISSTVASRSRSTTRSVIDPVGTGTRSAIPSSLPFSSGTTSPIARAAPVEAGMMLWGAARIRRRSGFPVRLIETWSWSCCSVVYACTVVMKPASIPKLSRRSFAIGPTEPVVQDAIETMLCVSLS